MGREEGGSVFFPNGLFVGMVFSVFSDGFGKFWAGFGEFLDCPGAF